MAIPFDIPEEISSKIEDRLCSEEEEGAFEDGEPTLPRLVPVVEDLEDERLPALDDEGSADNLAVVGASADEPPDRPLAAPKPGPWPRLRGSPVTQMALLSVAGISSVAVLYALDEPPAEPAPIASSVTSSFPTLEIEGAPPVTEEDIERRMRIERPESVAGPGEAPFNHDEAVREELKAIAELGRGLAKTEQGDAAIHRPFRSDPAETRPEPMKHRGGRWFSPGGTMKVEKAPSQESSKQLPLGVGDRLSVKLEVGISTGHSAPVLARLTEPVRVDGRVVAPEGAIAKGRFQSDARRVYLTFTELILPTSERLRFDGYAVDRKVPGLLATRIEMATDDSGRALQEGIDVAKDVARSVASGSIVGRIAQGATDGVLPEPEADVGQNAGFVLEVPAGKSFQIVITGADP